MNEDMLKKSFLFIIFITAAPFISKGLYACLPLQDDPDDKPASPMTLRIDQYGNEYCKGKGKRYYMLDERANMVRVFQFNEIKRKWEVQSIPSDVVKKYTMTEQD